MILARGWKRSEIDGNAESPAGVASLASTVMLYRFCGTLAYRLGEHESGLGLVLAR